METRRCQTKLASWDWEAFISRLALMSATKGNEVD